MTSRPKGIAVIVVIEKFAHLDQLDGIKKDIDNCTKAFEVLQFKVYPCKDNTADQIIKFIENIANDDHSQYDCFILYFSTHGGNGFVCCSDFQTKSLMKKHKNNASKTIGQNNTPKGFILFDTLLELFVNSKCQSLKENQSFSSLTAADKQTKKVSCKFINLE
ncbi:CASP8 [Mytilus edulis]|uniref:CASP8 n=1 Tax=Mytilus edulis TaxID=6550 RepID=A0A8S3PYU1_MYTED|nr:CASP8 [Mytilus edulis]